MSYFNIVKLTSYVYVIHECTPEDIITENMQHVSVCISVYVSWLVEALEEDAV